MYRRIRVTKIIHYTSWFLLFQSVLYKLPPPRHCEYFLLKFSFVSVCCSSPHTTAPHTPPVTTVGNTICKTGCVHPPPTHTQARVYHCCSRLLLLLQDSPQPPPASPTYTACTSASLHCQGHALLSLLQAAPHRFGNKINLMEAWKYLIWIFFRSSAALRPCV